MELRVHERGLAAIITLGGLGLGLIVLKDILPIVWLSLLESGIILSIVILTFNILLGERIRRWRMSVVHDKKFNKIAQEFYPDLRTLITDFEKFVGDSSEYSLSRIYEGLRTEKKNFVVLQELPNEQTLDSFYQNLKNEMHYFDGSYKYFSMLGKSLHTIINALASLTSKVVAILQWLGPNYREYIEKELKGKKITTTSEFNAWILEQYAIDEKTKKNYSKFREKFKDFCKDYTTLAKKVNGRADVPLIPPSIRSIPDRIE